MPEADQDALAKNMLDEIAMKRPRKKAVTRLKMPDFAARIKATCGGRKIDTASVLDYNKGRY